MELSMLINLVKNRLYKELKDEIINLQEADIAELLDELDIREALIVYRLLPKEMAADVFFLFGCRKASRDIQVNYR